MVNEEPIQYKAIMLAEAFHDRDAEFLATIEAEGRAQQRQIRNALWEYTDQLWDTIKAKHGLGFGAARDPRYSGVAGMRDLAGALLSNVEIGMAHAGDPNDDD
jgi:hypothetical protein